MKNFSFKMVKCAGILVSALMLGSISTSAMAIDANTLAALDAAKMVHEGVAKPSHTAGNNNTLILSEEAARTDADSLLDGRLDAVSVTLANEVITVVDGNGNSTNLNFADFVNTAEQTAERVARVAAEKAIQDDVDANQVASDNAEGLLSGRLDIVEGTGDGSITKAVSAEASLRTSADNALDGRLDAVSVTLANEVITVVDGNGNSTNLNFADFVNTAEQTAERVARVAAEKVIQDDVDDNQVASDDADNVLDGRATSLEGRATDVESRATSLEGRATDVESRATNVESRATSLETRADTLQGTITETGSVLNSIETVISAADRTATLDRGEIRTELSTERDRINTISGSNSGSFAFADDALRTELLGSSTTAGTILGNQQAVLAETAARIAADTGVAGVAAHALTLDNVYSYLGKKYVKDVSHSDSYYHNYKEIDSNGNVVSGGDTYAIYAAEGNAAAGHGNIGSVTFQIATVYGSGSEGVRVNTDAITDETDRVDGLLGSGFDTTKTVAKTIIDAENEAVNRSDDRDASVSIDSSTGVVTSSDGTNAGTDNGLDLETNAEADTREGTLGTYNADGTLATAGSGVRGAISAESSRARQAELAETDRVGTFVEGVPGNNWASGTGILGEVASNINAVQVIAEGARYDLDKEITDRGTADAAGDITGGSLQDDNARLSLSNAAGTEVASVNVSNLATDAELSTERSRINVIEGTGNGSFAAGDAATLSSAQAYADNNDNDTVYDDTSVLTAIGARQLTLTADQLASFTVDNDTVYDDTSVLTAIGARQLTLTADQLASFTVDNDTVYDDTSVLTAIGARQLTLTADQLASFTVDNDTVYDDTSVLTAIGARQLTLTADQLASFTVDNDTVYDDTSVLTAIGARQLTLTADQLASFTVDNDTVYDDTSVLTAIGARQLTLTADQLASFTVDNDTVYDDTSVLTAIGARQLTLTADQLASFTVDNDTVYDDTSVLTAIGARQLTLTADQLASFTVDNDTVYDDTSVLTAIGARQLTLTADQLASFTVDNDTVYDDTSVLTAIGARQLTLTADQLASFTVDNDTVYDDTSVFTAIGGNNTSILNINNARAAVGSVAGVTADYSSETLTSVDIIQNTVIVDNTSRINSIGTSDYRFKEVWVGISSENPTGFVNADTMYDDASAATAGEVVWKYRTDLKATVEDQLAEALANGDLIEGREPVVTDFVQFTPSDTDVHVSFFAQEFQRLNAAFVYGSGDHLKVDTLAIATDHEQRITFNNTIKTGIQSAFEAGQAVLSAGGTLDQAKLAAAAYTAAQSVGNYAPTNSQLLKESLLEGEAAVTRNKFDIDQESSTRASEDANIRSEFRAADQQMRSEYRGGIAAALAAGNIGYGNADGVYMAVGVAGYAGERAAAVGGSYRKGDKAMRVAVTQDQKNTGWTVGFTWKVK